MQTRSETKALAVAADRKALHKRLQETRSCLTTEAKRGFGKGCFDFEGRCLVGNNFTLQWQMRQQPDEPESYLNQQTNRGTVVIRRNAT
jgi:hypothetical protein